ncbi:MAG: MATE family efflux transporter [Phycisphaeraceae bacterium]
MNRSYQDSTPSAAVAEPIDAPDASISRPPARVGTGELSGRLAGLSLPRQVLVLAIWPLMEQILNFLVGMTDLMLAGRLSPDAVKVAAIDALGVAGYIGWAMNLLQAAVGVGSAALIARAIGARHRRVANSALGQSLLLATCSGVTVGVVIYLGAGVIGRFAGLEGQGLAFCITYLRIVSLVAPASAILFVGSACLRGAGDTRTPFAVMVVVNLTNAVASILLVFGPAPLGGHGVAGIAAGTAIAWIVGAAIVLTVLIRGWGGIRLRLIRLRPHAYTMKRIVRVGLPNLAESSGMWIGNFLILKIVGALGIYGAIGAHMIAIRIEAISFLPGFAIGLAAATLTGQYLGAGNPQRARQAVLLCWFAGAGIMMLLGLVFILIPEQLVWLISNADTHMEQAPRLVRMAGFIQVFFGTYAVLSNAIRGAGDTRSAMLMTYASTFLIRLPAAALLGVVLDLGLLGVWIALCGELIIRGGMFAARFLHGGWAKVKV